MHEPQQPTSAFSAPGSRLRLIALVSTIALAVALPLAAAVAGPAPSSEDSPAAGSSALPGPSPSHATSKPLIAGPPPSGAPHGTDPGGAHPEKLLSGVGVSQLPDGVAGDGRPVTSCGPELASTEGVQAQTCVLSENGRTWARSYYRNATNELLHAVLTLMRPDGRTLQTHCELPADDEPGTCETPRGKTVGEGVLDEEKGRPEYSAVLEIADRGQARLLLRSGSNADKSRTR
jgi:hypothetical protein